MKHDFYNFSINRWACGVIMFTLLVGCPPFWHRKQMVMLRNIMEGKYSFTSPEYVYFNFKFEFPLISVLICTLAGGRIYLVRVNILRVTYYQLTHCFYRRGSQRSHTKMFSSGTRKQNHSYRGFEASILHHYCKYS